MPATRRRPGRPQKSDGPVVTREAIVAVALAAVRVGGDRGLALREVARMLGVSLPTIQRHFSTRDELWRACVDAALSEVVAELRPGDITASLRAQVERSVTRPRLTAAMVSADNSGREYLLDKAQPLVEQGRALVGEAIDAGRARPVDPAVFVALVSMGLGSLASAREGLRRLHGIDLDDPEQQERFVDAVTDVLLYGIAPRS